ncbi:MAG: hypothetical protein QOF74_6308, partial [Caballeronia mineralivorans]|nr:hypothetical protein [Caballeronia mineralivorans]
MSPRLVDGSADFQPEPLRILRELWQTGV